MPLHSDSKGLACARCGHSLEAHEHYRRGSDCSLCDCRKYRSVD